MRSDANCALCSLIRFLCSEASCHCGLDTSVGRLALAQRIALAALAIFLMLNAAAPFITPDPPWLANLPLVVAITAFLLAFGLSHIRAERTRAAEVVSRKAGER